MAKQIIKLVNSDTDLCNFICAGYKDRWQGCRRAERPSLPHREVRHSCGMKTRRAVTGKTKSIRNRSHQLQSKRDWHCPCHQKNSFGRRCCLQ